MGVQWILAIYIDIKPNKKRENPDGNICIKRIEKINY